MLSGPQKTQYILLIQCQVRCSERSYADKGQCLAFALVSFVKYSKLWLSWLLVFETKSQRQVIVPIPTTFCLLLPTWCIHHRVILDRDKLSLLYHSYWFNEKKTIRLRDVLHHTSEIILDIGSTYTVTSFLIGWAHTRNDLWTFRGRSAAAVADLGSPPSLSCGAKIQNAINIYLWFWYRSIR